MMKNGLSQFNKKTEIKFCSMCGAIDGDFWETRPMRTVLLHSRPRYLDIGQCWVLCDECDEGLQKTALPKPDQIHLLAQIRRATISDQETVLKWLLQKFNLDARQKN